MAPQAPERAPSPERWHGPWANAYLDTGALYRAVTLLAQEAGLELADGAALAALARAQPIELARDGSVRVGPRRLGEAIRSARR